MVKKKGSYLSCMFKKSGETKSTKMKNQVLYYIIKVSQKKIIAIHHMTTYGHVEMVIGPRLLLIEVTVNLR